MSAPARGRARSPVSLLDSSAATVQFSPSRRLASSSDSLDSSPARHLRRGLLSALLCLPLLLALAAPAAAQTLVSFSSPDYPVLEGDTAKLDVVLSASRAAATTVQLLVFPTSATGQGVDYIGERHTVTIPAGHPAPR